MKKLFLVLSLVLSVLCLEGCGGKNNVVTYDQFKEGVYVYDSSEGEISGTFDYDTSCYVSKIQSVSVDFDNNTATFIIQNRDGSIKKAIAKTNWTKHSDGTKYLTTLDFESNVALYTFAHVTSVWEVTLLGTTLQNQQDWGVNYWLTIDANEYENADERSQIKILFANQKDELGSETIQNYYAQVTLGVGNEPKQTTVKEVTITNDNWQDYLVFEEFHRYTYSSGFVSSILVKTKDGILIDTSDNKSVIDVEFNYCYDGNIDIKSTDMKTLEMEIESYGATKMSSDSVSYQFGSNSNIKMISMYSENFIHDVEITNISGTIYIVE